VTPISTQVKRVVFYTDIIDFDIRISYHKPAVPFIKVKHWAGRSGDRIPVEARFSAPVQTVPGTHPASYKIGTGSLSRW
jgi:hypothetical protein